MGNPLKKLQGLLSIASVINKKKTERKCCKKVLKNKFANKTFFSTKKLVLVLFETLIQKYQQNFIMHYSHNISFLKKCIIYNHKKKNKKSQILKKEKKILKTKISTKKYRKKAQNMYYLQLQKN